ncbi:hypothetical protein M8J77_005367 [Diaphorina citri]|nr:hypothetical protein M8J77_005367 [Diaphorina citri]
MAFNKDFSTYFLTQPEEEDFQVSYTGNEDGFTCSHCNTSYEKGGWRSTKKRMSGKPICIGLKPPTSRTKVDGANHNHYNTAETANT